MRSTVFSILISIAFLACTSQSKETSPGKEVQNRGQIKNSFLDSSTLQTITKIWETDTVFDTPESVLPNNGVIYVSNVGGKNPLEKDGNGFISKLTSEGEVISLKWHSGLNAPKGMVILAGDLYVTDIDKLVKIDLKSSEVKKVFQVDGAVFLNDLTTNDESIYFSDMKTNKIHVLKDDKISLFAENLPSVNGLLAEENALLCLDDNGFISIDYYTKEIKTVSDQVRGGDGLVKTNSGAYVASRWEGEVYFVNGNDAQLLLDTKIANTQTADIGYMKCMNAVLVPTFFGNRVVAYKLKN